jgi:protein involved in polysaccharide export with SLBB domain
LNFTCFPPTMHCYHHLVHAVTAAVIAWTLVISGCATGGGMNTSPHKLLAIAKQFREGDQLVHLPRELDKGVLPAYLLEPGDSLLVQPANLDSPVRLPTDQTVLPDGQIELGMYGRLQVVGKTPEEVEREIQVIVDAATANAGPINVRLVGRQSKVVYVLGEVNSPGAYPLSGRETVLDAIIAAGGLTDSADQGQIVYVQPTTPDGCRVVLPVCYREIVQLGDTSTNYQVGPGDRIYIPSMTLCKQLALMIRRTAPSDCPLCVPQVECEHPAPHHIPPITGRSLETLPAGKLLE